MRVLYYDCFCGISGDMNLGALVDLGVDIDYLKEELDKLSIKNEFNIEIKKDIKNGITGTKVDVLLINNETNSDEHHHHHEQRHLKNITEIINKSTLNEKVKELSIDMFIEVAKAEAKVHGKSIEEVHFHEVGATDSIVDIVGTAICIDYLKVDKIMASTIQLGGGFVHCAHGKIPVPAPATVEILKGIPTKTGIVPFETTTPTGAAILKSNVTEYTDNILIKIDRIGYGLGTRDLEIPNVLRAYIGTLEEKDLDIEEQFVMETNIDDMNSELFGYVEDKLFEKGALDVFKTPIIMKKGRPAVKLSVLFCEEDRQKLQEIIFKNTTSAGLREYKVDKYMLQRDFQTIETELGKITIKKLYYNGECIKSKPEYEDCYRLAKEHNIPIDKVYRIVRNEERKVINE